MRDLVKRLWFGRRRKRVDKLALSRVLAAPPPEDEVGRPLELRLPIPPEVWTLGHHVAAVLFVAGFAYAELRLELLGAALLVVAIVLGVAATWLAGGINFARRISIADSGITVGRVFGATELRWWDIRAVDVRPDMREVRFLTRAPAVRVSLTYLPEDRRAGFVNAVRQRLLPERDVQEWQSGRWTREAAVGGMRAVTAILLGATFVIADFGGALGVRCSGPSAYLSQRFDVPRQPGCVFMRVSGATAKAGIHEGDQMIALDGTPVTSGAQFNTLFNEHTGGTFRFTVVRAHTHVTEDVTVHTGSASRPDKPPDDPITHYLAGKDDLGEHPQTGIREYTKAIALAPDFDLAYVDRGHLYANIGEISLAEADFRTALELDPQQAEAARRLAAVLLVKPLPGDEGIRLALRAIASDGCAALQRNNTDCGRDFLLLAASALRTPDVAKRSDAIAAARQALVFDPDIGTAYGYIALASALQCDQPAAEENLARYRKALGNDVDSVLIADISMAPVACPPQAQSGG